MPHSPAGCAITGRQQQQQCQACCSIGSAVAAWRHCSLCRRQGYSSRRMQLQGRQGRAGHRAAALGVLVLPASRKGCISSRGPAVAVCWLLQLSSRSQQQQQWTHASQGSAADAFSPSLHCWLAMCMPAVVRPSTRVVSHAPTLEAHGAGC